MERGWLYMKLRAYNRKMRFLQLDESFNQYDVISELEVPVVMQHFAQNRWSFPMTLYFEAYPFKREDIISAPLPVQQMPSEKRIISLSLKGMRREALQAFMVNIENEAVLQQAFDEFFYVAEQNHFFALTNEPCITYKGEDPIVCTEAAEVLLADYDGQGAIFITNHDAKENDDA